MGHWPQAWAGGSGDTIMMVATQPDVLVVDDDVASCDYLARALAQRGFAITIAHTASAARALAGENSPEFAVVELKIAGESGLKLISTLIRLDPDTRIVVLTGYGSIATAVEAIKLGAYYYLCKPANADEVVAAFYQDAGDDDIPLNTSPMSLKRLEWEQVARVLREHNGNISEAARALSMHRRTLQRKLAKHPVRR
jgi:two-component system response regulator RegA